MQKSIKGRKNTELKKNQGRNEKRADLLEKSEWFYNVLCRDLYEDFNIEDFKLYFKNAWEYLSCYISMFEIDRNDVQIINYLNRINELMKSSYYKEFKTSEQDTCIMFLDSLINTVSSYDFKGYRGGFYSNGVLYLFLPHQGGGSNFDEIFINEFDEVFERYCKEFERLEEE